MAQGTNSPGCGYHRSIALSGRESGKRARPGLFQCSNSTYRFQFTGTTRTPLHATKLPLRPWLSGVWLMLQSDKGISSIPPAEALGVSQPTAWHMGHALRLLADASRPWMEWSRSTASISAASRGGIEIILLQGVDVKAGRKP